MREHLRTLSYTGHIRPLIIIRLRIVRPSTQHARATFGRASGPKRDVTQLQCVLDQIVLYPNCLLIFRPRPICPIAERDARDTTKVQSPFRPQEQKPGPSLPNQFASHSPEHAFAPGLPRVIISGDVHRHHSPGTPKSAHRSRHRTEASRHPPSETEPTAPWPPFSRTTPNSTVALSVNTGS
jgi:hypothetical protein